MIVFLQDFVRVVSHFRPIKKNPIKNKLNSRMEKLHFAFRMYDLDGDDRISKVITFCFFKQLGKVSQMI